MALNFSDIVDVEIRQGGTAVETIPDLDFQEVTAFSALPLDEGSYDVVFFPNGSSTPAATVPIRVDGGQYATYTVQGDPIGPITRTVEIVRSDYPAAPPQPGNARVLVYHASAGAPNVDVRVQGGPTVITNLAYGQMRFLDVPAGNYTFEVVQAGTSTVVATSPNLSLVAGRIYDVFAVGRLPLQTPIGTNQSFQLVLNFENSTARVRVLHAVPDAPQVDVKVDGATVLSNFGFFASSGYLDVPSGNRTVELLVAGTSTQLFSATLSLNPGAAYTVAARGLVAGTGDQAFGVTVFNDNLGTPATGKAHVRVYHLSPDAPQVDVRVTGGATLVDDLAFKAASAYLPVDAGSYDLSVTTADGSATVLRTLANLESGTIYDIFAVGKLSGAPALRLETRLYDADTGYLSAVHAAIGAASPGPGFTLPVDIFVNGTQVLSDVTYFTDGPYLPLPTGFHTVEVKLAGTSTVAYSTTLEIRPDSYTSLVVRGRAGQSSFGANVVDNYLNKPAPGRTRLQVFHMVPGAPNVDVRVKNGPTLVNNLPFGEGSSYLEVAGGVYDLEIVQDGTNTVLKTLNGVQLRAGLIFDVYAVPSTGGDALDVQLTFNLPTDAANPDAQVRVLHAAPNAPAVDVYANGAKALSNFTFFSSSAYLSLPPGSNNVTITPAMSTTELFNGDLILAPGAGYTVAARGLLGGAGAQAFGVSVFEDELSAPAPGNSKVRVYHLSPDAPAVDLRATGVVTPLINDLAYLQASSYLEVPAGLYNLGVTTSDGVTTVVSYRPNLMSGTIYDVFAVGQLTITTPTLQLETRTTDTDTAFVRLVHAATGPVGALARLPVDVYVDGTKALSGTTFFAEGAFLPLKPGVHTIRVTPAMSTTTVYEQAITFAAGSSTSLIARGAFGTSSFGIDVVVNNLRRPSPGNAALTVYHLVPGAPNVDIRVKNGPTLVSNLAFGQASVRLEVAAGVYDLEVVQHGTTTVLLTLNGVDLRAGMIYQAYAVPFRSSTEADPPLDVKLGATFASDVPITNALTPIMLKP